MIELSQYQDLTNDQGFADGQGVSDLIKAMQAGQITGRDTANQGLTQEPLKAESLERTLKLLEFRMKDIKLWGAIPKLAAYNTVEEYIQLESYGTDRGGFYNEGELSDVEDSTYVRRAELVKYIQVTGEVTYQAQIVRSHVDAMRKEVENKTMWVIRKANSALTKADASIIPQEFNGIYKQHASIGTGERQLYSSFDEYQDSDAIIDLRGEPITQEILEDAAVNVDAAFGNVDSFFAPPTTISGLVKDFFQDQRIIMGQQGYQGTIGTNPKAIDTQFGPVALMSDKFMRKDPSKVWNSSVPLQNAAAATSIKAPNAPTVSAGAVTAADSLSKFRTAEGGLGTVFYAVSAVNRYGESPLTFAPNATTAITTANGLSVDLTFTSGGGAVPATGYVIYRSLVTTATNAQTGAVVMYPIFRVSEAERTAGFDGASAGSVRDRNRFLPNTEEGFVTEMVDDVLSFKQLAPLSKLDLAILGMSKRFITFLFGTPQLYAPRKVVRFLNIGRFTNP